MPAAPHATVAIVALTLVGRDLAVLLRTPRAERWELPLGAHAAGVPLAEAAARAAGEALGATPPSLRQLGAFDADEAAIAVAWLALVPPAQALRIAGDCAWHPLGAIPDLAPDA